jgi:type I restriction enzyme S subunit
MRGYPKYKDSGVYWIGAIPDEWKIKKIKHTTYVKGRIGWKGLKSEEFQENSDAYLVTGTDFKNGLIDWNNCYQIDQKRYDEDPFIQLQENDLLITKDGTIGKVALVKNLKGYATLNSGIFVIRPIAHYLTNFMYWILNSGVFFGFISFHGTGTTIKHLYQNVFEVFQFTTPPIQEQQKIAAYLNHKTTLIDTLIEKKKRRIDLLKEERTAVINQAVTKGLDPNVQFKDSGIEWLGEIPVHWEVKRLKHLVDAKLMYGANESAELEDKSLPRYIRITDFGEDGKLRDDTFKSLPEYTAVNYILRDGDILFARSGATVGKTFQFKNYAGQACFAGYLIKATPDKVQLLSDFLYFVTRSNAYENWKNSIFIQATIQNIGADKYNNFILSIPAIEEQEIISRHIEKETSRIDTLITKTQKQIDLLQEYRTALISEVVTGKIDVRDWEEAE